MRYNPYNVLLVKDNVGKAKPSTYNLPDINFAYGKCFDEESVGVGVY